MHNFITYHIDESSCFDIHGWPLSPQKVKPTGDSLAAGTPRRKGMGMVQWFLLETMEKVVS